jgi:hypothetical protein
MRDRDRKGAYTHITYEKIAQLFALGMTYTEIAGRLGCCVHTIFFRMRRACETDPKIAIQRLEQRTCKCGRHKRPSFSECYWCRHGKTRPTHGWNSGGAVQQALPLAERKPEATPPPRCEVNVQCECGRRIRAANAHACVLCQGTSDELDQLMAANRGISVEKLRRQLRRYWNEKKRAA